MRLAVIIEIKDEESAADIRAEPKRFERCLQDAFDNYWSMASMGSVRVVSMTEQKPPTEGETVGPLG